MGKGRRNREQRQQYDLTHSDLEEALEERMTWLSESCARFDAGREAEAKLIATRMRVILHDARNSKSLLSQLGLKEKLTWMDTAYRPVQTMLPYPGVLTLSGTFVEEGRVEARWLPFLEETPEAYYATFDEWWRGTVLAVPEGPALTRADVILGLADQDGGAHVDPSIDQTWRDLARSGALGGLTFDDGIGFGTPESGGDPVVHNPLYPTARQIAWELAITLHANRVRTLSGQPGEPAS